MKKCFVVCPIGNEGSDTRSRSDDLLNYIIKPVCKDLGFEAIRVDTITASDSINQTILDYLNKADLVIADLTDHNPNAFYELGYRFALGKPLIQLKHKDDSIPFDVSTIRTLDYDLNNLRSSEQLKDRLTKTIQSFNFETESNTISDDPENSLYTQILQELFKIQDSIQDLPNKIKQSSVDTASLSVLADKLVQSGNKTPDTVLIETLLPILINEPNKFKNLMEFIDKANSFNK